MSPPKLSVGVEVSATTTTAVVAQGMDELMRVHGPGTPIRPGRALASASIIAEVVRRGLAAASRLEGDILVVGAAGAEQEQERIDLHHALRGENLASTVVVTGDIDLAMAAAFPEAPGIVVSADTGSIAVGRDAAGQRHRLGGYGWQMGDEGSGYAIGRAALGAVSRARDGRGPTTALTAQLHTATKSSDFEALVRWAASATPAEVASLALRVLATASEGDPVALGIADYAARELTQLAARLAPALHLDAPVPVALAGGLLTSTPFLHERVLVRLREQADLLPLPTPVDAVRGALWLADRQTDASA